MKRFFLGLGLALAGAGIVALVIRYQKDQTNTSSIRPVLKAESPTANYKIPEGFRFCEEEVPLHIPDVMERFDSELHKNIYLHSNTIQVIKLANRWFPEIERILKEEGLPDDLKYIAVIESSLANLVSHKGATGFWQFMEDAGKEFGLEIREEVDERYDPIKSTYAACRYFKQAYKKFGNWTTAAASYNLGINGMGRVIENQKFSSYYDLQLPTETSRYIFRAHALKAIMENPKAYGYQIDSSQLYTAEQLQKVEVNQNISDLAEYAISLGINLKLLKRYNPWLRENTLTLKKGRKSYRDSYILQIPAKLDGLLHSKVIE